MSNPDLARLRTLAPQARAADAAPAPRLRIRDLGAVALEVDGTWVTLARKPAVLLTMLAIDANRRVSVPALIDAVWPSAEAACRSTLESHVWRLRKLLEPGRARGAEPSVLINDANGYRLVVAADAVDSLRFARLGEAARLLADRGDHAGALATCDEALALWRGRPFGAAGEMAWAGPAVARLVEVRDQIRTLRIDALIATGRLDPALTDSLALTREAPLREAAWAQRMLALYCAGRTDEALLEYRAAREVLREELGLDPGAQLKLLHQRILARDPSLAPLAVHGGPGGLEVPRLRAVPAAVPAAVRTTRRAAVMNGLAPPVGPARLRLRPRPRRLAGSRLGPRSSRAPRAGALPRGTR